MIVVVLASAAFACPVLGEATSVRPSPLTGRASGSDDAPKKPSDEEISKLLAGNWAVEEGGENGPKVAGTMHCKQDGTFESEANIDYGEKSLRVAFSGTWKVSDGMIIYVVSKTNVPKLIEEGHRSEDRVLSIDDKVLRYKTENGKEHVHKRKEG